MGFQKCQNSLHLKWLYHFQDILLQAQQIIGTFIKTMFIASKEVIPVVNFIGFRFNRSIHRIQVKTDKLGCPSVTLNYAHKQLQELATSIVPAVNFIALNLGGFLPLCLHLPPKHQMSQTLLMTNLPGTKNQVNFCGYDIVDWCFLATSPAVTGKYLNRFQIIDNLRLYIHMYPVFFY